MPTEQEQGTHGGYYVIEAANGSSWRRMHGLPAYRTLEEARTVREALVAVCFDVTRLRITRLGAAAETAGAP
jgi:hypothetical protein